MKKYFKLNYDEYLISQVFHHDFKPCKPNQEGREVYDEKFWEKKIKCIYEDCHYPINTLERSHIGDLLSGIEFEHTEFQKIILEGMNPIWRYLVISDLREKQKNIFGDMRYANFIMNPEKTLSKKGKGWTFIKKKNKIDFDVDPRIPIDFRPRKWIITPPQVNIKADYLETNGVQNDMKLIEEKLKTFEGNYDDIIDYLFNNWVIIQNVADNVSVCTTLKIAIYAIYYAHKLKDNELMDRIAREQTVRKCNGFTMLTSLYAMNKYNKTNLSSFKSKWAEENIQKMINQEDKILNNTNDDNKKLFTYMKRKCGGYLYKANMIWEILINSKQHDADKWFL
jgi:hypothetical protein